VTDEADLSRSPGFRTELLRFVVEEGSSRLPGERELGLLEAYFGLVQHWGRAQNLTRHKDPRSHARESVGDAWLGLDAVEQVVGIPGDFLDVGSGAGIPGVVAAVRWPAASATLVEPLQKRVSFLEEVAARLPLPSVRVRMARIEEVAEQSELVLSRATVGVGKGYDALAARVRPGGVLGLFVGPSLTRDAWVAEATRLGFITAELLRSRGTRGGDARAIAVARRA